MATKTKEKVLQRVYGSSFYGNVVRFPWRRPELHKTGPNTPDREVMPEQASARFAPLPVVIDEEPVTARKKPNEKCVHGTKRICRSVYITTDPKEIDYLDRLSGLYTSQQLEREGKEAVEKQAKIKLPELPEGWYGTEVRRQKAHLFVKESEMVEVSR